MATMMRAQQPGSRLPTNTQSGTAQKSWQGQASGVTGGGMTRVSPGVYRNQQGQLQVGNQQQAPATTPVAKAKTRAPSSSASTTKTPPPLTAPPGVTTTIGTNTFGTPEQQQAALAGYQGYRLPTQEELGKMFNERFQQEYADITTGSAERQAREAASREQQLANMGISIDSEAYRGEQRALAESRALEAAQARSQARQFAQGSVAEEFNRAIQAQTFGESIRQFNMNYALNNKKIMADIRNDKNLTKIQRDQLNEMIRSGDLNRAIELKKIAAQRAGDTNKAQQAADMQVLLWQAKYQYLTDPEKGLGMSPDDARDIMEKELRGGNKGFSIGMGQ